MADKYTLTLDRVQLKSILTACEKVARIELGQLDVLQDLVPELSFRRSQELKAECFPDLPHPGDYRGMRSEKVTDQARQLYDIFHTINHYLLETEDVGGSYSVYRQAPAHLSTECDLPKIKKM